jgi:hypothetical protein
MSTQEKVEYVGFMQFNRLGEEGWEMKDDFYTSQDNLVSVHLDNDQNNDIEEY